MKLLRSSLVLVLVVGIFLGLLAGIYIGRAHNNTEIRVDVAHKQETSQTSERRVHRISLSEEDDTQSDQPVHADSGTGSAWADGKLDINAASPLELAELPGIGEVLAQRIVQYRLEIGMFRSVEELTDVEGIGNKKMDAIREFVTVR